MENYSVSNLPGILVIDDEPNLRRSLSLMLERAGFIVHAAGTLEETRRYLNDYSYDLIFLDLKMPEINGLDLLPEIHARYPEIPVLILTAHATLESAIESVRKGARDYLLKPIDPEHIITRINQILDERQHLKRRREIVIGIKGLLSELNQIEGHIEPDEGLDAKLIQDRSRYLQRGTFTLDLQTCQVLVSGRNVPLSPTAFEYLTTLLKHSPDVVTCETLVAESQRDHAKFIEVKEMARWRIHELRKAIEPDARHPRYIITVRGIGYRLIL